MVENIVSFVLGCYVGMLAIVLLQVGADYDEYDE